MFHGQFDPVIGAILVGIVGIALWIITNVHLIRTGRAIKADIDAKRSETEAFVQRELASLQEDLGGAVELDANPLMAEFETRIVPAIEAKVESLRSVIQGKIGYAVKGVKALGEGVAELVGEGVAGEAVGGLTSENEMKIRLAQLGMDADWMKAHPVAAFGLGLLRDTMGLSTGVPAGIQSRILPGGAQAQGKTFPTVYGR